MSYKIRELRALSDDELIALHDQAAEHTFVGISYFLDELHRRDSAAAIRSAHRLATASTALSVVSVVIALVALFVR
jgi:hypothetical protein